MSSKSGYSEDGFFIFKRGVMDITQIAETELLDDRAESMVDIKICELALLHNIKTYSQDESVRYRLEVNEKIVAKIDAELARRKATE